MEHLDWIRHLVCRDVGSLLWQCVGREENTLHVNLPIPYRRFTLETICDPLYDHLRPRIIHETQILKLCELCTLLQTRYFSDPEDELEIIDPSKLDFGALILPALEDTQTRLVFRAQNVLRNDIENFKPKPEELDYPAKNKSNTTMSLGPVLSGRRKN